MPTEGETRSQYNNAGGYVDQVWTGSGWVTTGTRYEGTPAPVAPSNTDPQQAEAYFAQQAERNKRNEELVNSGRLSIQNGQVILDGKQVTNNPQPQTQRVSQERRTTANQISPSEATKQYMLQVLRISPSNNPQAQAEYNRIAAELQRNQPSFRERTETKREAPSDLETGMSVRDDYKPFTSQFDRIPTERETGLSVRSDYFDSGLQITDTTAVERPLGTPKMLKDLGVTYVEPAMSMGKGYTKIRAEEGSGIDMLVESGKEAYVPIRASDTAYSTLKSDWEQTHDTLTGIERPTSFVDRSFKEGVAIPLIAGRAFGVTKVKFDSAQGNWGNVNVIGAGAYMGAMIPAMALDAPFFVGKASKNFVEGQYGTKVLRNIQGNYQNTNLLVGTAKTLKGVSMFNYQGAERATEGLVETAKNPYAVAAIAGAALLPVGTKFVGKRIPLETRAKVGAIQNQIDYDIANSEVNIKIQKPVFGTPDWGPSKNPVKEAIGFKKMETVKEINVARDVLGYTKPEAPPDFGYKYPSVKIQPKTVVAEASPFNYVDMSAEGGSRWTPDLNPEIGTKIQRSTMGVKVEGGEVIRTPKFEYYPQHIEGVISTDLLTKQSKVSYRVIKGPAIGSTDKYINTDVQARRVSFTFGDDATLKVEGGLKLEAIKDKRPTTKKLIEGGKPEYEIDSTQVSLLKKEPILFPKKSILEMRTTKGKRGELLGKKSGQPLRIEGDVGTYPTRIKATYNDFLTEWDKDINPSQSTSSKDIAEVIDRKAIEKPREIIQPKSKADLVVLRNARRLGVEREVAEKLDLVERKGLAPEVEMPTEGLELASTAREPARQIAPYSGKPTGKIVRKTFFTTEPQGGITIDYEGVTPSTNPKGTLNKAEFELAKRLELVRVDLERNPEALGDIYKELERNNMKPLSKGERELIKSYQEQMKMRLQEARDVKIRELEEKNRGDKGSYASFPSQDLTRTKMADLITTADYPKGTALKTKLHEMYGVEAIVKEDVVIPYEEYVTSFKELSIEAPKEVMAPYAIQRPKQLEITRQVERTMPKTQLKELTRSIGVSKTRTKELTKEREIQLEIPKTLTKEIAQAKELTRTREQTRQKEALRELTRELVVPKTIVKELTQVRELTDTRTQTRVREITQPVTLIDLPRDGGSRRKWGGMGAFGRKGKTSLKTGIQPLLTIREKAQLEFKTGGPVDIRVKSTKGTRKTYLKNLAFGFGKSGLVKQRRR